MKKLLLVLTIFFASCRTFIPAPPPNPGGVYKGVDSMLYDSNTIYDGGFGDCMTVKPLNDGCLIFQNIIIRPEMSNFKFDTTFNVEYHNDPVIRKIRKTGTCIFGYNYMRIEYTVGEKDSTPSRYKFIGWKN